MVQSDPKMIKEIVDAVTIPVMAKVRIGHFVEAQVCLSGTLMPTQIDFKSIISSFVRSCNRLVSIISTSQKYSPLRMMNIT